MEKPQSSVPGRRGLALTEGSSSSHVHGVPQLKERHVTGEFTDEAEYLLRLRTAAADVVARDRETGIDLVSDGEYGHSMEHD